MTDTCASGHPAFRREILWSGVHDKVQASRVCENQGVCASEGGADAKASRTPASRSVGL
jgi:hypothetical protein